MPQGAQTGAALTCKYVLNIPSPISVVVGDADFVHQLARLPQVAGLYRLVIAGASPHLAWSANLSRRLKRIFLAKADSEPAKVRLQLPLERVDCWPTHSKLESSLLMYHLGRHLFPADYERRLRLRLPWFVGVSDNDGFPRLMVTNRRRRPRSSLWGPFPSRDAAEYYQEEVLRLYQIRRCTEPLSPAPDHQGCIYGEMNQCIRPCQCAVTADEYAAEFSRVADFLKTNGKSVLSTLSAARASASESMEFEQAAHIHKRIEQVKTAIAAREAFIAELAEFHGIAVTGGCSSGEVRLWPMLEGIWQEPIALDVSAQQSESKSLDADLKERITNAVASRSAEGDPFEHLSLFLRWYRSSWRDGAWLGFASLSSLNYRRLVREVSKLANEPRHREQNTI